MSKKSKRKIKSEDDFMSEDIPARDIRGDLENIYADADVSELDKLEQIHHSPFRRFLIGLSIFLAILTAISWLGFFLFSPQQAGFAGDQVEVSIEGTDEPKGAAPTEYMIRWKNNESIALGTSSLELRIPSSFQVTESPVQFDGEIATWEIGTLGPDKDGSLVIKGYFRAETGRQMDLQAVLTYRPANFNSEFQKVATKTVTVTGSGLVPQEAQKLSALPGDSITIPFGFRNESGMTLENIRLRAVLPSDFILESSEPALTGDSREWLWPELAADATASVTVTGTFDPNAEGARELKAEVGLTGDDNAFLTQATQSIPSEVFRGDLLTSLILNGQTNDQPIRLGEQMRFAVTWRNTGTLPIRDVTLTALIGQEDDKQIFNWDTLVDKAGGIRDGNRLTWTKKLIPALETIEADDEGSIAFTLQLDAAVEPVTTEEKPGVTSSLEATIAKIGDETVGRTIKTAPIAGRLVSDAIATADARYFDTDNQPVGAGPLPPKVGEATTYRIYWQVDNTLHELNNLRMSAKLPDGVVWSGYSDVDAGDIRYDAASGKIIWTLNWMPLTVSKLQMAFDVTLTPTAGQKGNYADLLEASIFEATDKMTGDSLISTAPPLTTALPNDTEAIGKAKVE